MNDLEAYIFILSCALLFVLCHVLYFTFLFLYGCTLIFVCGLCHGITLLFIYGCTLLFLMRWFEIKVKTRHEIKKGKWWRTYEMFKIMKSQKLNCLEIIMQFYLYGITLLLIYSCTLLLGNRAALFFINGFVTNLTFLQEKKRKVGCRISLNKKTKSRSIYRMQFDNMPLNALIWPSMKFLHLRKYVDKFKFRYEVCYFYFYKWLI